MPRVLRLTRNNLIWDNSEGQLPWLEIDDIAADPLTDLKTILNELSIFIIQDDLSELDRCLSAMATQRKNLQNLDYILFDADIIDHLKLEINNDLGKSYDQEVNKLHRNIIKLSAKKLTDLAKLIMEYCDKKRILEDELSKIITMSINNNWIQKEKINKKLLEDIRIN